MNMMVIVIVVATGAVLTARRAMFADEFLPISHTYI